ncbi:OmpA family protein [Elusimicrobiota bacterium]
MKGNLCLIAILIFTIMSCTKKPVIKQEGITKSAGQEEGTLPDIEASIRGKDFTNITELKSVLFDFDQAYLMETTRRALETNADFLKDHPTIEIRIDGHCDERGTNEYNVGLGQRRARAVRAYYMSLGIPPNRMGTLSWGEEKSACREPSEACWRENRRVDTLVRAPEEPEEAETQD